MSEARGEARLFVLGGPDLARSFPLGERTTMGRSSECDVVLRDRSISRKHARLKHQEDGWVLEDLGSTNGISKDGRRAKSIALSDGDEFKLGDLPLRLRLGVVAEEQEIDFDFEASQGASPEPPAAAAGPSSRRGARAEEPALEIEEEVEIEDEDEIEIEIEEPDEPLRASAPTPAPALGETAVRAPRRERHTSFLSGDLGQRPLWLRALVFLVVLGFAAGLAFGAFQAVQMLRSGME